MRNESKFKSWLRTWALQYRLGTKSDCGQAVVELAVMLPVALTLLLGIAEIGRYANASIVVGHAARAGVQYAAQNRVTASSNTQIIQAAQADAQGFSSLTVTASHYCTCADGSSSTCQPTDCQASRIIEYSKVVTQTTLQSLFHYPGLPQSFAVKGKAIMRVSQ
jgi:Flp pilus assembly protein TadG